MAWITTTEYECLNGKTIQNISVDGYSVSISFTDGTSFLYDASDAGYSTWNICKEYKG